MGTTITMECCCCGNRDAKSFKQHDKGYICGCCGVVFYPEDDRSVSSDEKIRTERGYANLRNYEFAKARYAFMDVLSDYPDSIDARWGLLLAKYGVVFIKGFFDGVVEPIYCFPEYDELSNKMFRGEKEYGEILELIEDDEELIDFYEKKSRKIDTAIRKFRECKDDIVRDVFLCVKISAATERDPKAQGRTEDYEFAQRIYNDLRAKKMNVFFSFVTLHNEINSDHEIWLNLVKSKKMLLIGSKEEYIESAWVKSEWKRWLFLDRHDDMYICSMRHDYQNPKSILPHELRTTQIYTLDTYDKLIKDISGETADEEELARIEAEERAKKEEEIKRQAEIEDRLKWEEQIRASVQAQLQAQTEIIEKMKAEAEAKAKAEAESKADELYKLGNYYFEETEYYEKAAELYFQSAELGNVDAQRKLGDCYYYGFGVTQDYAKAVKWLGKSAEQGDAEAQYALGCCYYNGEGVTENNAKAVEWYTKSADQGHAEAQYQLGECYYYGFGVTQDYAKAVEWYTKSAEQDNEMAQYQLGKCYYYGFGVTQDYVKAVEWYTKSAEQDNAKAQWLLGGCYYNGEGVTQDYVKAVEWYIKSAEQGNAEAQCLLGGCYYTGKGVTQDYVKAVEWYMKSAEQGNAEAQSLLGFCYCVGEGVAQNYTKAVEWYMKSAEQGNALAQYLLGECYYNGEGVAQNYTKAVEWYTKAAEQGELDAQNSLGICYEKGYGTAYDLVEAKRCYQKAMESGSDEGRENYISLIEKYAKSLYHTKIDKFYIANDIPEKIKRGAVSYQRKKKNSEKIIFLLDYTVFGSGKDGFILTPSCIIQHFIDTQVYDIHRIKRIESRTNEKVTNIFMVFDNETIKELWCLCSTSDKKIIADILNTMLQFLKA